MTRIYPIKLVPLHNNMKHMKRLKAALFDLDGTLIASEQQYTEFWSMTGKKFCPDIADFAYRIKGATLENILTTYIPETCWEEVTKGINDFEKTMVFPTCKGCGGLCQRPAQSWCAVLHRHQFNTHKDANPR